MGRVCFGIQPMSLTKATFTIFPCLLSDFYAIHLEAGSGRGSRHERTDR